MGLYDSLRESEDSLPQSTITPNMVPLAEQTSAVYENVRRVMRENGGVLGAKRENFVRQNPHVPRTTLIVGIVGELRDPSGKVVGSAGAGKDTVAQAIIDRYTPEIRVKRVALADALKCEVYDFLRALSFHDAHTSIVDLFETLNSPPLPPMHINPPKGEKIQWINGHKTVLREMLQNHGSEFRRGEDERYWLDRFEEEVARLGAQVVLCPDVRFLNETSVCHATLKVVRPVAAADPTVSQHVSETELAEHIADFTVMNNGDLQDLIEKSQTTFLNLLVKFHVH